MQLEKTVDMMTSEDPKERLKAEYHQVLYRANKLRAYLRDWDSGKLAKEQGKKFKPVAPFYLLKWQLRTMEDYIYVLKTRAALEGIDL